jgi:hypothetical protein
MADIRNLTGDAKLKLGRLINEGMQTMHELDVLREGLNETVKAVAEELEIKPAVLKKAIKIAHKAQLTQTSQDHELLVEILEATGKTL